MEPLDSLPGVISWLRGRPKVAHFAAFNTQAQLWGPEAGCAPPCVPAASYSSMVVLGEGGERDAELGILYMRNNASMLVFEGRGVSFMRFAA